MNIVETYHFLIDNFSGWKPQLDYFSSFASDLIHANTTVLDIGCGRVSQIPDILKRSQNVIGIDPDADALRENSIITEKILGGIDRLSEVQSASVDVAISTWVLEHLDNPETLFYQLSRILSPGGSFLSLTPNKHSLATMLSSLVPNSLHAFFAKVFWGREEKFTYPAFYKINTVETIKEFARKYGFEVIEIKMLPDPSYYMFHKSIYAPVLKLYKLLIKESCYEGLLIYLVKR